MQLLVLLCLVIATTEAEVFTSLVDLEHVIYVESNMLDALDKYINDHESQLQELRRKAENLRKLNSVAKADPEVFLGHPVNSFQLVKRFIYEWVDLESTIRVDKPRTQYMVNVSQYNSYFPASEDLSGATAALLRLQDTYKLKTKEIADGRIPGIEIYKPSLKSDEVLMIGKIAYNGEDHYHAKLWLTEALERNKKAAPESKNNEVIADILDYLAFSVYKQGDMKKALELTNELLQIDPKHERGISNKVYFEYHVKNQKQARGDVGDLNDGLAAVSEEKSDPTVVTYSERQMYEALCRGDKDAVKTHRHKKNIRKLKCSYQTYGNPLLFIQPAKEEVLFDDPRLIIFHDIISPAEIKHIKATAAPRLKRATIQNSVTGNLEFADYRISKSAWLKEDDDEIVYRIRRRVSAYTGLDLQTAEDLQVVNYGIGGHYEPHFDFARKEEVNAFKDLGTGNRIATVLFYMSNIEAGGATVFPHVGARVRPSAGSAAFWFNLFRNGDGNHDTRHAACPVLAGSKWVSNIWIHELGQEFRRQCSLNANE